jgi:hypothetical protein
MYAVACHCWYSSQAAHAHAHLILPGDPTKQVLFPLKQAIYFHPEQLLL